MKQARKKSPRDERRSSRRSAPATACSAAAAASTYTKFCISDRSVPDRFTRISMARRFFVRIRIAGVVTQNVVVARLRIDPLQRLVEVVRVDDRDSRRSAPPARAGCSAFRECGSATRPDRRFLVEIRPADEAARIDRVDRGVGAVGFPRQLRRAPTRDRRTANSFDCSFVANGLVSLELLLSPLLPG